MTRKMRLSLSVANTSMCMMCFKGTMCSSEEEIQTLNFNIYNINEVIIQTLFFFIAEYTSCSQRKRRYPEHYLKQERWQGPPDGNKKNSMKLCRPLRLVCLLSLFSHDFLVCLDRKTSVSEDTSLLIQISFP